ncbi:hypothetical protein N7492_009878 [Penicillium capsulatum]|uniref:Exo-1,4-beta-D-glucosaminidase n=1 Tax=Penicillium capsulatum TaxID=69766 RepID=A0A9W9LEM7_9EURO|nr:hypothetical protein N7492_009878 [Penicillium capsulatum]KAJ6112389.1 hypothetical protein N7512_007713 [Penicillium capsulatum]
MQLIDSLAILLGLGVAYAAPQSLTSSPGHRAIIPKWYLQSAEQVPSNVVALSRPGADVSQWDRVGARGTVMAGLIENGVYNDTELFFSDNMKSLTKSYKFQSPWIYRNEFDMDPTPGEFFTLHTHGITSKADIYVNGAQVASSEKQIGSFGGHRYNLTDHLRSGTNCILIRAYPTNYLRDFAMGFVDWNPYPPDNGTGVWRHVEISQTRGVAMSPFRVLTEMSTAGDQATVTLKTDLTSHVMKTSNVTINGSVKGPDGVSAATINQTFTLGPHEEKKASIKVSIKKPHMWWPAGWGKQHLYNVSAEAIVQGVVSDKTSPQLFGIRQVTSHVNEHNDTAFSVNDLPFQVLGAGYSPDIFMRFDMTRMAYIFKYMLEMGLNTIRLEGKPEHSELYELADQMGMMVLSGWECCDKWEGWEYNHDASGVKWGESDYIAAAAAMRHDAEMMQAHPSILGFLLGSDYWPNDRATDVFLNVLGEMDWDTPVIASASKRGYPKALGPSGMKMEGPYDWVPPNYWYGDEAGAAFGFGSELGAGVGTPELRSLKRFMSDDDLDTLWTEPEMGLYHMSNKESWFHTRTIYNEGLFARYGEPRSLEDYIAKCQMADYEATRAQFEAYSTRQNASRPATGTIYWMLSGAWPNLRWQLFDYFMGPMGAYFGTKVGTRVEHVAYDYERESVWLINHSREKKGKRQIMIDLVDVNGKTITKGKVSTHTTPGSSKEIIPVEGLDKIEDLAFLRLVLRDGKKTLSRNVYWLSSKSDVLNWDESNWYYTPVTNYSDLTRLQNLPIAIVKATAKKIKFSGQWTQAEVRLENKSKLPAVFLRMNVAKAGNDVTPVIWSDNYVTLWPREKMVLKVSFAATTNHSIELSGRNIQPNTIEIRGK